MTSENHSDPGQTMRSGLLSQGLTEVLVPAGVTKSQRGWRSRDLSQEEVNSIGKASVSGNITSLVAAYEGADYEYSSHASRGFVVNDRDYTEMIRTPSSHSYRATMEIQPGINGIYDLVGYIAPQTVDGSFSPAIPSETTMRNIAGGLLRRAIPTKSEINLTRIAGESREAPLLFKAANYRPRNPAEVAGSYLNYLFGVKPTVSDLQSIAETVQKWDSHLRSYVAMEKRRIRRSSTEKLGSNSDSGMNTGHFGYNNSSPIACGPMTANVGRLLPGSPFSANDSLGVTITWSCFVTQSLRQFSTFEYFVPRPRDLMGRLDKYRQLAQSVIGGGLDESTAYDLTPWTWLAGWFVDVGGLLRYQQSVADNQVVASTCGYSFYEEGRGSIHFSGLYPDGGSWPAKVSNFTAGAATFEWKHHIRRGSSPYSIGPTWDLSQQQWAILGALGLSRAPGVPIKR